MTEREHEPGRRSDERGRTVIPRGEVPCVWMTAGVLSFRLCDRDLDCARCPLDRALRNAPDLPAAPAPAGNGQTAGGTAVPEELFFHPGHTWVRVRSDGSLEVGIDDLARRLVGEIEEVRTPEPGDRLTEGREAFVVRGPDGPAHVAAPFSGRVSEVNPELRSSPGEVGRSPYGAGWILRARPDEPSRALTALLGRDRARSWMEREERKVRDLLELACPATAGGPTLPDGGRLTDRPLRDLPPESARRILFMLFRDFGGTER